MVILGIDPGVATIGFGIIRAERGKNTLIQYGVITTPPGIPLSERLVQIYNDMEQLIDTFKPDEMAVEDPHPTCPMQTVLKPLDPSL